MRDEDGVVEKFGVRPASIPDYLGLVGDSSDGFPGVSGWGAKSAGAVLAHYGHIEDIPDEAHEWDIELRGRDKLAATLRDNRDLAMLCKDLATLRVDDKLIANVDELEWNGPTKDFENLATACLGDSSLASRVAKLSAR
jgi:5'-3' exonuclease